MKNKVYYTIFRILLSLIVFIFGLCISNISCRLIIFIISYLIIGYKVIIKAITNFFKGKLFDENFLMTIATIGAFCIKEYDEAVAVMLLYTVGELLQDIVVDKSKKNITDLMNIKSDYANVTDGDILVKTNIKKVNIGDIVVVKPGEKIPLDGVVVDGASFIDTSSLTGESIPVRVGINDEVLSGCINQNEVIKVRVEKKYDESTVYKVLEMVESATNKKSKNEKFISKFTKIYTPIVVLIAILIIIISYVFFKLSLYESIYKALVCLVISCPCALVISVPLSYFAGIGCASKNGILVKGSSFIDRLSTLGCMVFDKTGTLTRGVFEVVDIDSYNGFSKEDVLKNAAYAELFSTHPIGNSIISKYNERIDKGLISNYKEIPGMGVSVKINNKIVLVGNMKLLVEHNIDVIDSDKFGTIVYVSINGKYAGNLVISDIVKDETKSVISKLNNMGIDSVMLTGDNLYYASEICNNVGIKRIYSDLLPDGKVDKLEEIMSDYKRSVAFVGDGMNDSPVLGRSDVGIAMGGIGSDAAIEAADVVLMNDDLNKIIDSINISKKIIKIVVENIIMILLIKTVFMVFGILGIAHIWQAVVADVGVTIITVVNSMRCLRYKSIK